MTIAKNRLMTLDEYLTYDDGTDTHYELENGTLVEMSTENPLNNTLIFFLISHLIMMGIPPYRFANGHAIQVISDYASVRIPDLVDHSEASIKAILQDSQLLRLDAPAPILVVEAVSSSNTDKASRDRDYIFKRAEYAHRGIPEYWIIDPEKSHVLILTLSGKQYTENRYTEKQLLASTQFPAINITAEQVLSAGISS